MLDKLYAEHSMSVEDFAKDPVGAFQKYNCSAIAITINGDVVFYASERHDYEEMIDVLDYLRRGDTEVKDIPSQMEDDDIDFDEIAEKMAKKLKDSDEGDFE
ncbi:hypothetical protein EUZ85_23285 [Hahella sp. KA22]|uniref:hypothetical protein n=1 Tax=Hahella sp. KA22 TaxID=1628392 RepID=UPI000FDE4A5B|nr:hypothetical protein [Hahella sp. KA22]AZZ93485.1 hypothetical protein ENC22_20705 [Hahella sp. KA22]QAY56859.1 hypothetical protein EUZ85_23285 [Hahella sp. KA22]